MNRLRLPIVAGTLLGGAVIAAACSGTAATPSPAHSSAPAASTIAASAAAPSAAAPSAPTGAGSSLAAPTEGGAGPSFAIPSFAIPSFTTDSALAAKFPTTIDGQPVSGVQTFLLIDILRFSGQSDQQLQQLAQSLSGFGITLSTMSSGQGDATVDGSDVQISAVRAPGADAASIVTHFNEIQSAVNAASGNPAPSEAPPTITQATVGGKNVSIATDSGGNKTYLYPSGDTLWSIDNVTDSQAAKIVAALQ